MDQDYDRKFEEMKKYIPFLESMIKRLESNNSTSGNPRQAQLAKIRSLRDLLLDKKKRMKMENLLKCEQVLVNLYAKVEQRDSLPDPKNDIVTSSGTQNSELNLVRSKLKNVVSHLKDQETLPEIARASNTEGACTAGSKEPALFQRRPNKTSISPPRPSLNDRKTSPSPSPSRTYTRVLISPERDTNWPQDISSGEQLFSRRSPKRTQKKSPREHLSPHHKKEKKKFLNQSQELNELKDLNITLKVPEESLNSLNTKDILSRIINCNDNDVDIDTLRGLRTQILSELKQTGAKDDISDLILKSYNSKKDSKKKKKEEIEEGELSDSESEIIESIYGSLVIVDKEQNDTSITKSNRKAQESRKIQICLVINSERENQGKTEKSKDLSEQSPVIDQSDFESFKHAESPAIKDDFLPDKGTQESISNEFEKNKSRENKGITSSSVVSESSTSESNEKDDESKILTNCESEAPDTFRHYKPVLNTDKSNKVLATDNITIKPSNNMDDVDKHANIKPVQVDIPLLDLEANAKNEVVQEIDILQALKKEILGEKISVSDSETATPPLHQPKVTKVANMRGMITKKRISIEKYKEKTTATSKTLIPDEVKSDSPKDELSRKQSIKLTEKEYERFNLSNKLTFDESSEDEEMGKRSPTVEDVYADLAPKSPDHEDFADTGIKPPVIIPVDPVKTIVVSSKADVDMRITSVYSPHVGLHKTENKKGATSMKYAKTFDVSKKDTELNSSEKRVPLADPRVSRRDFNNLNHDSSILGPAEHGPRPLINFSPNMTPTMIPNMLPNMTPNRMPGINQTSNAISNMMCNSNSNTGVYEMTPSRQTFENDDYSNQSHVYTPMFLGSDTYDNNDVVNNDKFSSPRNNFENVRNDLVPSNNAIFNRPECPPTPMHPFGMADCPPTPTHAFGHLEPPMTPIQTFGRCDAPMTPIHPFGRADCPPTPNHPFGGRTEILMTPTHPFGRSDFSLNQVTQQIPPLLYNNFQDHRPPNRNCDYDNFSNYNDEIDCKDYNERNFNPRNYKYDQTKRNYSDSYRHYGRQPNNSRGNKNSYDQSDSHYGERSRRESSIGRSMSANNKNGGHYSNDRKGYRGRGYRYENDNARTFNDGGSRNNFKRDQSVGRNQTERKLESKDIDFTSDNILSIESHAGRSFVIDTSVNRSFQETLNAPSFDARRRRASSVGRSLTEEKSSEKSSTNTKFDKNLTSGEKRNNNRRACSVGRDVVTNREEKNFNDIKQELQSYKSKQDEKFTSSKNTQNKTTSTDVRRKINERDPRLSRRDEYDIQQNKAERVLSKTYSQRGYNRDPRLRREFHESRDSHRNYPGGTRSNSREIKKHGIVYSTDNLAKGTILGSGYGVKNYKIPKIKKVSEEKSDREGNDNDKISKDKIFEDSSNKISENEKQKTTGIKQKQEKRGGEKRPTRWANNDKAIAKAEEDTQNKDSQNMNKFVNEEESTLPSADNVEKRVTRSSQRNNATEPLEIKSESPKRKYNKIEKLDESGTETAEIIKITSINAKSSILDKEINVMEKMTKSQVENIDTLSNKNVNIAPDVLHLEHNNIEHHMKQSESNDNKIIATELLKAHNSSNSLDDEITNSVSENKNSIGVELEIFSDNVATDHVIENINALIADLDDDLETSKNDGSKDQFKKEITLENMLDNITCDEKQLKTKLTDSNKCSTDTEQILDDLSVDGRKNFEEKYQDLNDNLGLENQYQSESNVIDVNIPNSEVSTTEGKTFSTSLKKAQSLNDDQIELCSTPDSTIDLNENNHDKNVQEGAPDSTNEHCEMSSDITSTHTESKNNSDMNQSARTELANQNDSIGSLLSILKDKTKIKELLSMLQDQSSENYKLKKKLEKLSEIVSDDEDISPSESNLSNCNNVNNSQVDTSCKTENAIEQMKVDGSSEICFENNQNEKDTDINVQEKDSEEKVVDINNKEQEECPERTKESEELRLKVLDEIEKDTQNNDTSKESQNYSSGSQNDNIDIEQPQTNKKSAKNIKATKKSKAFKNNPPEVNKRLTRLESGIIDKSFPVKKPSRELKQLQEDIKEMFMRDDVFNATGIRMCRLAKLVEDKTSIEKDEKSNVESPVVVLEKVKQSTELPSKTKMSKKKQPSKSKVTQKEVLSSAENDNEVLNGQKVSTKLRPGPKSKTKVYEKQTDTTDPYVFESDSFSESYNTNIGESKIQSSSESECESLESSNSICSNDILAEIKKKPKRKRRGWQAGVIKPKHKKKKKDVTNSELSTETVPLISDTAIDENTFTDKTYHFSRSVVVYSCRFCAYNGNNIVHHYKKAHPHSEVPLSRLSPETAKAAIRQCEEINFQAISKIPMDKYVCRFCFKEFTKKKTALEAFFWHVVSVHTGEYKLLCSKCVNVTRCPFNLDIPPPPKEAKGQLIGYICGKCNFTQISLENLKSHVINRHNDEQTEVFTINLSVMTKKTLLAFTKISMESKSIEESAPRVLRSRRSNNTNENNDESIILDDKNASDTDKTSSDSQHNFNLNENQNGKRRSSMRSHTSLENEDADNEMFNVIDSTRDKFELMEENIEQDTSNSKPLKVDTSRDIMDNPVENVTNADFDCPSDDVLDYAHFKVTFSDTGAKEYVCCINGTENHYRTVLLISFKKHVQLKHKEKWDGFCCVCKVIVTPQGDHYFKDCLQHFLDKHIDDFPVMEKLNKEPDNILQSNSLSKSYLSVRPMSELISQSDAQFDQPTLPIIESVVSLGEPASYETQGANEISEKCMEVQYKYEEAQAVVMASKNNVVRDIMMSREKIVHIFKCAGRYCSYSTDNAEDALRHSVAHERVGGEKSLDCAYCDFDSSRNAVDLVTHVFKAHGSSPFVCGRCFYRAAASQLVRAHELRLHGKEPSLIYRSTVTARPNTAENILPRQIAVPFYVCCQDSGNGACQFKTYTSVKFSEHLQTRHKTDNIFVCCICSIKVPKTSDLLQHMKHHGFKVYQCTWCVHGADSETELLAHASEKHPNKQPQAYLRIITNKEGTSGFRVLPLAQFNNSKISTIDITPNNFKGNPEKEAERSIDLEKLIGQTTQMMESMVTSAQNTIDDTVTEDDGSITYLGSEILNQNQESLITGLKASLLNEIEEELTAKASIAMTANSRRAETPNLTDPSESDVYKQATPVIKTESVPTPPEKSNPDVVYCLDSDEETPNNSFIDLSAEESAPLLIKSSNVMVPKALLFKCGLCRNAVLKSAAGLKMHVSAMHPDEVNQLPCAHCSFVSHKDIVASHYISEHSMPREDVKRYICDVCNNKYVSFTFVKKHLKFQHNLTKLVVTLKQIADGEYQYVVGEVVKKKAVKRKSSTGSKGKSQPPVKIKKFGPKDVDSLPINPILDELVYCALCEFSTKVRLNMVRHLQLHAEQQPVPQTNPVNPVPYLETNEKHFDKMLNLASSSIASIPSRADKGRKEEKQAANQVVPPEMVSRYPKYVPDKQRYTCGAKACCYTSVDENMFKQHWETLHSGSKDYHCVHCPPHQHMDTSKPLTALRIVSHLKMHAMELYACSDCPYYHNARHMVETHIAGNHSAGNVMVVREMSEPAPSTSSLSQPPAVAPTMDLKAWQCGLCKFKSMLRPEVVDHCAKMHQSKMQYKCTYCAFRASNLENITKHQSTSHANKAPETFYFYYREGSVPDEPDGTPRWQKQRLKSGIPETRVKSEAESLEATSSNQTATVEPPINIPVVDLNIVKKDPDAEPSEQLLEVFYPALGQFCEPNGLKYKCPLCENVSEETREAMQSHLYEELKYRKWACGFCSYKAFHRNGLNEHMNTEHRQYRDPIELPVDPRVETWITKALDHQFLSIERNRHNLAKQAVAKPKPSLSPKQLGRSLTSKISDNHNVEELQNMFGQFGEPDGMLFNCPKCNYKVREEDAMQNHLEIELTKIRWCCNSCAGKFQNYHEAQFHCKSAHAGFTAKPIEAVRDANKRAAWITATLQTQKLGMANPPAPMNSPEIYESDHNTTAENSLLVVRYEEPISTPEMANLRDMAMESDEEDEKLVIDEPTKNKESAVGKQCPFCLFKCKDQKHFREHIAQHVNLRPYFCSYCDFNGYRKTVLTHLKDKHEGQPPLLVTKGQRSQGPPLAASSTMSPSPVPVDEEGKLICLRCEKSFSDNDAKAHVHDNIKPPFAKKGEVVVKCCLCLRLHLNIEEATAHHQACHPNDSLNYAYYKLQTSKRSVFCCAYCEQQFKYWQDLKAHWKAIHSSLPMQFNKRNYCPSNLSDEDESGLKRRCESSSEGPPPKMCARKSTTKLPLQTVAKKSTTKLPLNSEQNLGEEYCHYGSKPRLDDLDNVTTSMTFCNTDVPFTLKKLSKIIKIDPIVLVEDVKK